MFRNASQRGLLTVFFSGGCKPLRIWETHAGNGYFSRFMDKDIYAMVMEIGGANVSTTYMTCPIGNQTLGIRMPFLIMVVKNIKKYFSFEVTIMDDTHVRRRFRASNFQSTTAINPLCTAMPLGLSDGWNQIQFNLAEFTRRAYKNQYHECVSIKVNANIQIRRIYFAEKLIPEDQLPKEYKLFIHIKRTSSAKKLPAVQGSKQALVEKALSKTAFTETGQTGEGQGSKVDISETPAQEEAKENMENQTNMSSVTKVSVASKKSLAVVDEGRLSATASVVNLPAGENETERGEIIEGDAAKEETEAGDAETEVGDAETKAGDAETEAGDAEAEAEKAEGEEKGPEAPVEDAAEEPPETAQTPVEAPPEEVAEAT